jgi:predicted amidohydrolase
MAATMLIGLAQLQCLEGEKEHNLLTAEAAIAESARGHAGLVVLPELHTTGFLAKPALAELAEKLDGPSVTRLARAAAAQGIAVVTSFLELGEAGFVHNTAVFVDDEGHLRSSYRKCHLFDAERPLYVAGEALDGIVLYKGIRFGLLICYDIEFPETARQLALLGVDCILGPTANMAPYGHRHRVFATARALENHVYVAYCNRCGTSREFEFPGESVLVDPLGQLVCEADSAAVIIYGDVDVGVVPQSKDTSDYLAERRPELYVAPHT